MVKVSDSLAVQLSEKLQQANKTKVQIEAPSKVYPELTIKEAYSIQLYNIAERVQKDNGIVGKKIGLTSKAMQDSLGVDEPDYGILSEDMVIPSDNPVIKSDQVIQPRVEGEMAFILKKDLEGPNITVEDVLDATESILACIEIVDSRVKNWNITIRDTIAAEPGDEFTCRFTEGFGEVSVTFEK